MDAVSKHKRKQAKVGTGSVSVESTPNTLTHYVRVVRRQKVGGSEDGDIMRERSW